MKVEIIITDQDDKERFGILGVYTESGVKIFDCDILERSFKDNAAGISSIPFGTYPCAKVAATKHISYPHISIMNVPDRAGICLHILNYFYQSEGCIGLGKKGLDINNDGENDLTESKITFDKFMSIVSDTFDLTIKPMSTNS